MVYTKLDRDYRFIVKLALFFFCLFIFSLHRFSISNFVLANVIKMAEICSHHDIAEILLKLVLNTNQSINQSFNVRT